MLFFNPECGQHLFSNKSNRSFSTEKETEVATPCLTESMLGNEIRIESSKSSDLVGWDLAVNS